jgi:hypothetical protein
MTPISPTTAAAPAPFDRAQASTDGWFAALSDAIHMADNAGNAWLKEKLTAVLEHLGGVPPGAGQETGEDGEPADAEPGPIRHIAIDPDGESVDVTYRDGQGSIVDQAMFDNAPFAIATNVRAFLLCDAFKHALKDRVHELAQLGPDELDAALAKVADQVLGVPAGGHDFIEALAFARDTFEDLAGQS